MNEALRFLGASLGCLGLVAGLAGGLLIGPCLASFGGSSNDGSWGGGWQIFWMLAGWPIILGVICFGIGTWLQMRSKGDAAPENEDDGEGT